MEDKLGLYGPTEYSKEIYIHSELVDEAEVNCHNATLDLQDCYMEHSKNAARLFGAKWENISFGNDAIKGLFMSIR